MKCITVPSSWVSLLYVSLAAFTSGSPAIPLLLQPLHESHAKSAIWAQALCSSQAEDGRDATTQHVLDWGAIPEESCGCPLPVPRHTNVHLRLCFLPQKEQPVHYLWGMPLSTERFKSLCLSLLTNLRMIDTSKCFDASKHFQGQLGYFEIQVECGHWFCR